MTRDLPADDFFPMTIEERRSLPLHTKVGCWLTLTRDEYRWTGPFTVIANDTTNGVVVCIDDRAGAHEYTTFEDSDDLILWPRF